MTLKKEYLWPYEFASYQDAEAVVADTYRDSTTPDSFCIGVCDS